MRKTHSRRTGPPLQPKLSPPYLAVRLDRIYRRLTMMRGILCDLTTSLSPLAPHVGAIEREILDLGSRLARIEQSLKKIMRRA